jgi:hypothetical protein
LAVARTPGCALLQLKPGGLCDANFGQVIQDYRDASTRSSGWMHLSTTYRTRLLIDGTRAPFYIHFRCERKWGGSRRSVGRSGRAFSRAHC